MLHHSLEVLQNQKREHVTCLKGVWCFFREKANRVIPAQAGMQNREAVFPGSCETLHSAELI